MTNTSFSNDQRRSHIRKSQIEMYQEKRRIATSSTRIMLEYDYKEYGSQVCTATTCNHPVLWRRGRRVYSVTSMRRWCAIWAEPITLAPAFVFWPKQCHFFLQMGASLFQLRCLSFLVELGWVCLSFFLHVSSSRCFHRVLGSGNHYVISKLW